MYSAWSSLGALVALGLAATSSSEVISSSSPLLGPPGPGWTDVLTRARGLCDVCEVVLNAWTRTNSQTDEGLTRAVDHKTPHAASSASVSTFIYDLRCV